MCTTVLALHVFLFSDGVSYKIVGDNIDKTVTPRYMRLDCKVVTLLSQLCCAKQNLFTKSTHS